MTKEDFERQVNTLVPAPDFQTTAALFRFGQELGQTPECDGVRDLLNSLDFISRHFDQEVLQNAYGLIRQGSAALPGELVAAAVLLQDGDAPESLPDLIQRGHLLGFYAPKEGGEISPLAVCCIIEGGKMCVTHTEHFGSFDPEKAFWDAKGYAGQHGTSVTEALQHAAADGTAGHTVCEPQRLLSNSQPEITEALCDIFACCPAVAAQIMFDADWDKITVEHNPLWLELRQGQDPAQGGMEQTM